MVRSPSIAQATPGQPKKRPSRAPITPCRHPTTPGSSRPTIISLIIGLPPRQRRAFTIVSRGACGFCRFWSGWGAARVLLECCWGAVAWALLERCRAVVRALPPPPCVHSYITRSRLDHGKHPAKIPKTAPEVSQKVNRRSCN